MKRHISSANDLIEKYELAERPGAAELARVDDWRDVAAQLEAGSTLARSVYLLYREIRTDIEDADGGWNGGAVVDLLCQWFVHIGLDPAGPIAPSPVGSRSTAGEAGNPATA